MELINKYQNIIGSLSYGDLKPGDKVIAVRCMRTYTTYRMVSGSVYEVGAVRKCGAYDKDFKDMCDECKDGCPSGRIDVKLKVQRKPDSVDFIDFSASCGWELQMLDGRRLIPVKKVE